MTLTRSATSSFVRILVAAGLAGALGFLFAVVLFLSALFSHSHVLGMGGLVALAVALLGHGVTQGSRAYLLFEAGSWKTLGGRPTSRSERPRRFVAWVTLHALGAVIHSALAAFMIWIAISSGH